MRGHSVTLLGSLDLTFCTHFSTFFVMSPDASTSILHQISRIGTVNEIIPTPPVRQEEPNKIKLSDISTFSFLPRSRFLV